MTTRKSLPYDVARCHGADDPKCDQCARQVFSKGSDINRHWQFWMGPQIQAGHCPQFIDMEMSDD